MKHTNIKLGIPAICLMLGALTSALASVAAAQAFGTTTVQGTVYLANGEPGSGTLQLSWPAFSTAANQAVAAGRTTVSIGYDGFVSVNLAPNLGSMPAGLYYTAIYHLSDGTTSTEYWVVPAAAQAAIAQVRATVMPAAQAVQAVNKAYVDQSIAELVQSQVTSSGGSMTGPLFLNGDPATPTQAATKHYVDNQMSQTLSINGGAATGPLTATQLGGVYQADQFQGGDFGAKLQACINALSSTYGGSCDARNFSGTLAMGSNVTIANANVTINLPCATIATSSQIIVTAGTRNVTLHGCASRGTTAASGNQGGTVFLYSGSAAVIQVGDSTYASDTLGFHLDNVVLNTTSSASATAQAMTVWRAQELHLEGLYLLGNANQTGITLDGTGNYTGGTFDDVEIGGFQTAVSAAGHKVANAATTDWVNASTFVRLHIDCPTSNGSAIAGTTGIDLAQGDGNTITGGDVEGCATALHLGANAQNNTIVGLRNENSTYQVVADTGSAYNNWITGGTMFTGKLTDNGTRNSFLDTFHRSFNALNGDWFGSQQDATLTNHYRLGIGSGNERGLLYRYQTDSGYRWTMGLSDATAGEQYYTVLDELNNVNRLSIGQYNTGQGSSNNQTVINAAGTGAVVLNGSNNAGSGGVVFGSGGPSSGTVATINNSGNAQFNGTLQVSGASTFLNSTTIKNQADAEIDAFLWAGATAPQKESVIYKDWNGNSQWYMVKDTSNNWALNSAVGGVDSFKAYQSNNSGDTYIDAANNVGVVRVNYEPGSGSAFNVYGGSSSNLYASFNGTTGIKFPGLAAGSGHNCVQIDNSGYLSNTGSACAGSNVGSGTAGQIAYYPGNGSALAGMSAIPIGSGGTGATTATGALATLGGLALTGGAMSGPLTGTSSSFSGTIAAGAEVRKQPTVDVTHPDFGVASSCTNGADPSGANDSTCAIKAAIAYDLTLTASGAAPALYFPHGNYKISSALRIPCSLHVFGDGENASIITQTTNTENGVTIIPGTFSGPDAWTCAGSIHDLAIGTNNGHSYTATLLELLNAVGYHINHVREFNGGGRGIVLQGNTERVEAENVELDTIRWPLLWMGNENHIRKLGIAGPGMDASGYCFAPNNCVNGVSPSANWTVAQALSSVTANGTTGTVVVTGGSNSASTNGISPQVAGHWFTLAGVTGTVALNGVWQIASVTNNSPTSTQYTITFSTPVSGTGTVAGATFKPTILPERVAAVFVTGDDVVVEDGSIKSLAYTGGFDAESMFGGRISNFYTEGYPVNGQPRLNSDLVEDNLPPQTTLTSTLASAGASATVASTAWFSNYINNPTDALAYGNGSGGAGLMRLLPPDYIYGSTAGSAYVSGVQKGQFEDVNVIFASDGAHFLARNNSSSTAPSGTAWPSGSMLVAQKGGSNYGVLKYESGHLDAIAAPGPNWAVDCVDNSPLVCASVTGGSIPNNMTTFTTGQAGPGSGQPASIFFDSDEWWWGGSESLGMGYVKMRGVGGGITALSNMGYQGSYTAAATTGTLAGSGQAPLFVNVQETDASYPYARYHNLDDGTFYSSTGGPAYFKNMTGNYADTVTGGNPGSPYATGLQYSSSYCFDDTPTGAGTHSLNRFCFTGAGFEYDAWSGSAWSTAIGATSSGLTGSLSSWYGGVASNNTWTGINTFPKTMVVTGSGTAYSTILGFFDFGSGNEGSGLSGQLSILPANSATSSATVRSGSFVPALQEYDVTGATGYLCQPAMYWSSNTSATVTPTVETYGIHFSGCDPASITRGFDFTGLSFFNIPSNTTGTTQSALNNSTKLATTAYGDAAVAVEKTRALAAEAALGSTTTLCRYTTDVANTGSTSEANLHSCAINAGTMGANSKLEFHMTGNGLAGNTGTCTFKTYLSTSTSAMSGSAIVVGATATVNHQETINGRCLNRNSTSAQVCDGYYVTSTNGSGQPGLLTTSNPTASTTLYINFAAVNSVSADTCTMNEGEVVLWQ